MAQELETTAAVIDALGGLNALAALTGSTYKAVGNWKAGSAFPARTFLIMTSALRDRGYSAPASLWGMVTAHEAAE